MKKMTDIFDDIPVELLDEVVRDTKRKRKRHFSGWAAVITLVICALAGTAGYAAVKYHMLFEGYFERGDDKLRSELMQDQYYEAKNEDYCLRVEGIMSDGDVKNILVSVEALNEKSRKVLEETETIPELRFTKSVGSAIGSGGSVRFYEDFEEEGKKYYMFEWHTSASECTVMYAEGMPMYAGPDWMEKHEEEILRISFTMKDKTEKAIIIPVNQNDFPDEITFDKVEVRRMSVKVYGTFKNAEEDLTDYACPTVTAILKDGTSVRLMQGNMGYEKEKTDEIHSSGGGNRNTNTEGGKTRVEIAEEFQRAFDIDQIAKIKVNEVEYAVDLN